MPGRASRYLAGLCVAAIGLVAGGWLALTPYAFGFRGRERLTALATGAGLAVVAVITLTCWSVLWRRRLRADGVLGPARSRRWRRSKRRQARAERLVKATRSRELAVAPDPAQVLTDLRELLTPLLADQSLLTDRVVVHEPGRFRDADDGAEVAEVTGVVERNADAGQSAEAAHGPEAEHGTGTGTGAEPGRDGNHLVQVPGQLRGTRSASFLLPPAGMTCPATSPGPGGLPVPPPPPGRELLQGAELLVVGSGEEESW